MKSRLVLWLALLSLTPLLAQTADATHIGESLDLSGNWRFHTGDDPSWSAPDFDDSDWPVISTRKTWAEQGYASLSGLCWYRLRVTLPADRGSLSLLINHARTSYEVYANGVRIGQFGGMPPNAVTYGGRAMDFRIPADAARRSPMVVAIRLWHLPLVAHFEQGGLKGVRGILIGRQGPIEAEQTVIKEKNIDSQIPDGFLTALQFLLGVALLFLYFSERTQKEYLWLGLVLINIGPYLFNLMHNLSMWPTMAAEWGETCFSTVNEILILQFVFAFLRIRMPRFVRVYQFSLLLIPLLILVAYGGRLSPQASNAIAIIWIMPMALGIPVLLLMQYRRGNREAGLLGIPYLLLSLSGILDGVAWVLFQAGLRPARASFLPVFQLGPMPVSFSSVAQLLSLLSIGLVLLERFQRTSRDRERATAELEAARTVQSMMLPKQVQRTPGFAVESVYWPAQEVGGDFFQVIPGDDGSLLVVVGDVSGKGLKAAMLVSLILGSLREIVAHTRKPADVLERLNRALAGQIDEGFATCLCAQVSSEGRMTIANAGHLAPYCNGEEIEVESGLPLGITADAEYEETMTVLSLHDRLLFVSDGVPEARNAKRELYGFDRLKAFLARHPSPKSILDDARAFGQEDDISVLSVTLQKA